jgi:Tfp pilus assembly protein PilF
MLERGGDNALLRFGLGNEYLKQGDFTAAALHLAAAIEFDPGYSAAYKLLGKALTGANDLPCAIDAYERGIAMAQQRGDMQAVREMNVFLKRLRKQNATGASTRTS